MVLIATATSLGGNSLFAQSRSYIGVLEEHYANDNGATAKMIAYYFDSVADARHYYNSQVRRAKPVSIKEAQEHTSKVSGIIKFGNKIYSNFVDKASNIFVIFFYGDKCWEIVLFSNGEVLANRIFKL